MFSLLSASRGSPVSTVAGANGRNTISFRRSYAAPVRQGVKKKTPKRKLSDMPGYKKKLEESLKAIKEEIGVPSTFIKLFGPDSNYPPPPPEPERTGPYSELFPGEDEIPKETEILMGEMDREFERLRYKTAVILQDPDFIIYDSLVQYRIQELEVEWLQSPGPVTRESKAELDAKIAETVFETEAEFADYFKDRANMTAIQIRQVRQTFLDEMEGRIHFFPQDKWKLQVMDPKFDLEKHPLSMKERVKLFTTPTARLAANPKLLYQQYRELAMHVNSVAKPVALPTERVLAHFDLRKHKVKLAEMEKREIDAELEQMEFEKDMLLHAHEDHYVEGDY